MIPKRMKEDLQSLKRLPRWALTLIITIHIAGLIPFALAAKGRVSKSSEPQIHIIHDMDHQPIYKAQQGNPLFVDGRAMRDPVEGTVARGELWEDTHFYQGRDADGEFVTAYPEQTPLTRDLIARGQNRFAIFCAPCHGASGDGNGMVNVRAKRLMQGWTEPSAYNTELVLSRPLGHLFNTITHGIRNMPGYASQISVEDRWAIVSYLKVLQTAQSATLSDVSGSDRARLEQELK